MQMLSAENLVLMVQKKQAIFTEATEDMLCLIHTAMALSYQS